MNNKTLHTLLFLASLLVLPHCSGEDAGSTSAGTPGQSPGVSQGGAQDFGLFREIIASGQVPSPDAMDDVGFFNEHKLTLPTADCGEDICIHGLLGVMGNMISGSNCTMVLVGMNTPIDPSALERPPLNLAIAIDTSGSMLGDNMTFARRGLQRMLSSLTPEDRVTLVAYNSTAEIVVENVPGNAVALSTAINDLQAAGATNIYDGLRFAFEAVERNAEPNRQNRVIVLSDGIATAGITNTDRVVRMAKAYAERSIGITSIGLGDTFNVELMRDVAEAGSGNFYFLEDPQAVEEVFTEEIQTFLVPLAEDIEISFSVGGGYVLREIYGTHQATYGNTRGSIEIPSLFIAHRTTPDDTSKGRRGGGGGILIELLPVGNPQGQIDPNEVGLLTMTYRVPGTTEIRTQTVPITSPLLPGETPVTGLFDADSVEKGFVMLNLYVGLQMAATRATAGDNTGALAVLDALDANVATWLRANPDADIEDDLELIQQFQRILVERGATETPPAYRVPEPWPVD